jgi:hypothetical protein
MSNAQNHLHKRLFQHAFVSGNSQVCIAKQTADNSKVVFNNTDNQHLSYIEHHKCGSQILFIANTNVGFGDVFTI